MIILKAWSARPVHPGNHFSVAYVTSNAFRIEFVHGLCSWEKYVQFLWGYGVEYLSEGVSGKGKALLHVRGVRLGCNVEKLSPTPDHTVNLRVPEIPNRPS
jgi:hypothetical protein